MSIPGEGFNGLPTELTCSIFRLAIDSEDAKHNICKLMLVCHQWKECVESSPSLWTDVSINDGLPYVRQALEKSGGAMIDVRCPNYSQELEAFMAEVGPHIARWRSLMVAVAQSAPPPGIALSPLTTTQAPSLESLKIVASLDYPTSGDAITLFGGTPAPSTLKALNLFRFPVAFEPLNLSGLVSLDLVMVHTISMPQLLEMLRGSPRLETLALHYNRGLVAIESQPSSIQPIELPKLVSLSLTSIDDGGLHCILSNIRIPNRRCVTIGSSISRISARSVLFTSSITHILHTTIPTTTIPTTTTPTTDVPSSAIIVTEHTPNDCKINFRGIAFGFFPMMDGEDYIQEILRWLADSLGLEAAECPVYRIVNWSKTDLVRLAAVPHPLAVKHLSFKDSVPQPSRKALYTAMVQPPHPASSDWLLPQMESLSIEFSAMESQKQPVSMLKSRYGGATSAGETESRCPMKLRSVELRGRPRTEGLVEEIRGILVEADVFWTD